MNIIQHFVGGKSFSGDSKRIAKVFNPATGEQSAEVKLASTKDVNYAISNAKKAFDENLTLKEAALKLKLISEREFDKIVDPKKMI